METSEHREIFFLERTGEYMNKGKYSEIMMHFEPEETEEEENIYESAHVDQLLETSYI